MVGQALPLGCPGHDIECLCSNANFTMGIRDCAAQTCPAGIDFNQLEQYGAQWCGMFSKQEYSPFDRRRGGKTNFSQQTKLLKQPRQ